MHVLSELTDTPTEEQLDNIKSHLDLILIALESLAQVSSEEILAVAQDLSLEETIRDRVNLWRLRQSNPLRQSSGGRKKLDVEEARSLVLIICRLAFDHKLSIRSSVKLVEKLTNTNEPFYKHPLLGDYLDRFNQIYEERIAPEQQLSPDKIKNLALSLLISLLFYSSKHGHRRLWLALLR